MTVGKGAATPVQQSVDNHVYMLACDDDRLALPEALSPPVLRERRGAVVPVYLRSRQHDGSRASTTHDRVVNTFHDCAPGGLL